MSPKPKKIRTCTCPFRGKAYKPIGLPMTELDKVTVMRDELEALKLCDAD